MRNMTTLLENVIHDLEDIKAIDVVSLDVHAMTPLTDYMVIATGTSSRHVNAVANNLVHKMKERGIAPLGVECDNACEWALVDLGNVVVHVMQVKTRNFYQLEKLWSPLSLAEQKNLKISAKV
jgi:ribosome-associated protein